MLLRGASKERKFFMTEFTSFEKAAREAVSKDELRLILGRLREFANHNCWHPTQHARIREIIAFIEGRLLGL
jgi:hypothetical protein